MSTVHIAGLDIQIGPLLRQRCAWCDTVLVDYDLTCTASPCGDPCKNFGCRPENHRPATWPVSQLVEVDGAWPRVTALVPHIDGDPLPDNACSAADTHEANAAATR